MTKNIEKSVNYVTHNTVHFAIFGILYTIMCDIIYVFLTFFTQKSAPPYPKKRHIIRIVGIKFRLCLANVITALQIYIFTNKQPNHYPHVAILHMI